MPSKTERLALNGGLPVRKEPFQPWPDYGEEEVSAAAAVLRSGKLARQSRSQVRQFEEAFAEHFGACYASLDYRAEDIPPAARSAGQLRCLPVFPELADEEVEALAEAVCRFFSGGGR